MATFDLDKDSLKMTEKLYVEHIVVGDGVIRGLLNFHENAMYGSEKSQDEPSKVLLITETAMKLYDRTVLPDVSRLLLTAKRVLDKPLCGKGTIDSGSGI